MSFGPDFSSSLPPTPALAHAQASGRAAGARLRGCEAGTARAFSPADSAAARSSSSFSIARSVRQRMASACAVVAGPRRTPGAWVRVGKACRQGGVQAGRQPSPRGTARAFAPADGGRAAAWWMVVARQPAPAFGGIGSQCLSASVDRDSLACVRCSPARNARLLAVLAAGVRCSPARNARLLAVLAADGARCSGLLRRGPLMFARKRVGLLFPRVPWICGKVTHMETKCNMN